MSAPPNSARSAVRRVPTPPPRVPRPRPRPLPVLRLPMLRPPVIRLAVRRLPVLRLAVLRLAVLRLAVRTLPVLRLAMLRPPVLRLAVHRLAGVAALLALALTGCASSNGGSPASISADAARSAAELSGPVPVAASAGAPAAVGQRPVNGAADPAPATGPSAPVRGEALPPGVPEPPSGSNQLVTVLVPSATSTAGTLRVWQRAPGGGWTNPFGPVRVKVGIEGVGTAQEGRNRTPRGTFPLDQAFGRKPNPGTALPYRKVGTSDWWVSDQHSPAYNTFRSCAPGSCPFDESAGENLGQAGPSYDYAVVIGYNTKPVRAGAGSAFFVHVDAGVPSAGCVQAPRQTVLALLRWLNAGQRPRITIGLG